MALQSEAAPPVVGEAHKDTNDGETKSEDNDTEEEEDLEEGEILDSGNEADEEQDTISSSPVPPLKKDLQLTTVKKTLEAYKLTESAGKVEHLAIKEKTEKKEERILEYNHMKFKKKYVDHDQNDCEDSEDKESSWYQRPSRKKSSAHDDPIDYRKELALYAGSPHSSPERDGKSDSSKKRKRSAAAVSKAKAKKAAAKRAKQRLLEKKGVKQVRKVLCRKPCKFFLEGNCTKGGDCPFSHAAPRERKRELCRYYLNGFCSKGRQCPFMHDDFPCKFFHTGAECYSGENCRFSHKPLTEETKKLLQECLKGYHNDDHHEPRKKRSKSPEPPTKRPCLLGSPPRHIREAAETKRWQEEMFYLQQKKSTDAFQICLSPTKQFTPPNKFARPNFYVDTMQSPPKPGNQQNMAEKMSTCNTEDSSNPLPDQKLQDEDLRPKLDWANICALVESMKAPKESAASFENSNCEDERKFKEQEITGESVVAETEPHADLNSMSEEISNEKNETDFNQSPTPPNQETAGNSPPIRNLSNSPTNEKESVAEKDPIVIPTHLPRKQQELLLRIQRHQKMKSASTEDATEVPEKCEPENQPQVPVEQNTCKDEEEDYEEKGWTSSDDDDDDADKPLTDVLKKLRQTPPPKPKEIPQPKPAIDISQMLSNIMQKANENSKTSILYQEQGKFWQNILSGTVLPSKPSTTIATPMPTTSNIVNTAPQPTKRRVLLPDPKPVEKVGPGSRDPRLKNRDPRTAAAKAMPFGANSLPNASPPILPLESRTESSVVDHHRDLNSKVPSHTPAVVVDGLKANVPYKLHGVTCKPLNYSTYIQASHSDPKLLNDPRLRKHMSQDTSTFDKLGTALSTNSKSATLPDLPLFSNFPLPAQDNSISSAMLPHMTDVLQSSVPELKLPQQGPQVSDPRTRRSEQRRPSGSNTPPDVQTTENPLTLPAATNVPVVASHLPRAIADPRMAKLHKPLDPRRLRVMTDSTNKTNITNRLQSVTPSTTTITKIPENSSPKTEVTEETEKTDKNEAVSKKKFGESRKNKAVHRNRKSSMDYASPLNSCDDNSTGTLNYNSYNQRPQTRSRNNTVEVPLPKETLPTPSSLVNALVPDFSASDSSNLDCDSLDASASLKDMFKTIDPTASPFC